jgi:hypothetical protein
VILTILEQRHIGRRGGVGFLMNSQTETTTGPTSFYLTSSPHLEQRKGLASQFLIWPRGLEK